MPSLAVPVVEASSLVMELGELLTLCMWGERTLCNQDFAFQLGEWDAGQWVTLSLGANIVAALHLSHSQMADQLARAAKV